MKIHRIVALSIVLTIFLMAPSLGFAQISSSANAAVPTEYASGAQDNIYIFCGLQGQTNASLTATSPSGSALSFEWLKYNTATGNFDPFLNDVSGAATSTISNLQDGAYRVNISTTSGNQTFTAWVFNNYIETTAAITASDCNSLTLTGTSNTPALTYYDLTTRQAKQVDKGLQVKWTAGSGLVGQFLNVQISPPPPIDTDYTLTVTDKFGCSSQSEVQYLSIVSKANFTPEFEEQKHIPTGQKEAPLSVKFNNTSINGDPGKFQWFIYKDRDVLLEEGQASPGQPIDSILTMLYSDSPTYIFEKPGSYNVKLVSQKQSASGICYDTIYITEFSELIKIDVSFLEAPNFFTPGNSDGQNINERFVVRFFSMKSVKISIFNRWGKTVHVWESDNVQGFGATYESIPQSVWDGKIGGKLATPGVYYYVVEGVGRDDKKRNAHGFVHLFREK